MDTEAWSAAVHGVSKSRTRLIDLTEPRPSHVAEDPEEAVVSLTS